MTRRSAKKQRATTNTIDAEPTSIDITEDEVNELTPVKKEGTAGKRVHMSSPVTETAVVDLTDDKKLRSSSIKPKTLTFASSPTKVLFDPAAHTITATGSTQHTTGHLSFAHDNAFAELSDPDGSDDDDDASYVEPGEIDNYLNLQRLSFADPVVEAAQAAQGWNIVHGRKSNNVGVSQGSGISPATYSNLSHKVAAKHTSLSAAAAKIAEAQLEEDEETGFASMISMNEERAAATATSTNLQQMEQSEVDALQAWHAEEMHCSAAEEATAESLARASDASGGGDATALSLATTAEEAAVQKELAAHLASPVARQRESTGDGKLETLVEMETRLTKKWFPLSAEGAEASESNNWNEHVNVEGMEVDGAAASKESIKSSSNKFTTKNESHAVKPVTGATLEGLAAATGLATQESNEGAGNMDEALLAEGSDEEQLASAMEVGLASSMGGNGLSNDGPAAALDGITLSRDKSITNKDTESARTYSIFSKPAAAKKTAPTPKTFSTMNTTNKDTMPDSMDMEEDVPETPPPITYTSTSLTPASSLKQSSYTTPVHRGIPPNSTTPPSTTGRMSTSGTGLPMRSGPLFTLITVSAQPNSLHPTDRVVEAAKEVLGILQQMDPTVKLFPLFKQHDHLPSLESPTIAFPSKYTLLTPYVNVTNPFSLRRATGKTPQGRKKEQYSSFLVFSMGSEVDADYIIQSVAGEADKVGLFINVKSVQQVDTVTQIAIAALSNNLCPVGLETTCRHHLKKNERKMIKSGKHPEEFYDVPLPEFKVMIKGMKEPRLSAAYENLGISAYEASLKKLVVVECATADLVRMEPVWKDWQDTKGLRRALGRKATIINTLIGNVSEGKKLEYIRSCRAHMGYNHHVTTMEIEDIVTLEYPVYIEMVDKSMKRPYKVTTLRKEILEMKTASGEYLVQSVVPIGRGPSEGKTTIVFRNTPEYEHLVTKFQTHPAPYFYHYFLNERKYSLACTLRILNAFSPEVRILAFNSTWDEVSKTVKYKHANVADDWLQEMDEEGFGLAPINKATTKSASFTDADKQQVADMMRLKPDDSVNDSNSGMSRRTNATHTTSGNDSVRSVTSVDVARNYKDMVLENAQLRAAQAELKAQIAQKGTPHSSGRATSFCSHSISSAESDSEGAQGK